VKKNVEKKSICYWLLSKRGKWFKAQAFKNWKKNIFFSIESTYWNSICWSIDIQKCL